MDIYDESFLECLASFQNCGVRYLIVGGFATNFHGYARVTSDVDIWLEDSPQNRRNLINALEKIGLGKIDELMTAEFVPGFCEIMLNDGTYMDLMGKILGFEQIDFEECYQLAERSNIGNIEMYFLHFNHLLTSKQQSHRIKDQLDAQELLKIQQKQ